MLYIRSECCLKPFNNHADTDDKKIHESPENFQNKTVLISFDIFHCYFYPIIFFVCVIMN